MANGMYGLMLVEPKTGLPKYALEPFSSEFIRVLILRVDREYFVLQSEFYTRPDDSKDAKPSV
jgi:hypothetical protein